MSATLAILAENARDANGFYFIRARPGGTTLEKCEGPDSQENYQAPSGRFPIVRATASQYRRTVVFLFVKDTPVPPRWQGPSRIR